jgi:adenylate cyclase
MSGGLSTERAGANSGAPGAAGTADLAAGSSLRLSRHQMRTPVHHILDCAGLLLEEAEDLGIDNFVPVLEELRAAGQAVLALVDQLADRPDPGQRAGDVAPLIERLIPLLDAIVERGTTLETRVRDLGRDEVLIDLLPIAAAARCLLALTDQRDALVVGTTEAPLPLPDTPPLATRTWALACQEVVGRAVAGYRAQQGSLLVVDDSEVNRDTLARRLERLGYVVLRAANGREALEILATTAVDVVLLDVIMPEMDGYEVLEWRRADERLRSIPFIMISALDEFASVVRCIEMGAEDYLSRPFDPVLLRARVGACLEKKRWHDQEAQYLATIEAQADELRLQAAELAAWNHTLEARVQEQVDELERTNRLRRFLSPQVAEAIVSARDERLLESHRREITVVFTDLRGFTAFAEMSEPEDVMAVLADYHRAMGEVIFEYEGTLERFTGDGLMVFFNDPIPVPDAPVRAIRMAVAMRARAVELTRAWRKRGYDLGFAVGIALGYATLGRIGFEGRFDYGAIGTVTNLAARLCGEAEAGQILVTERVYLAVEADVEAQPLGELALKEFVRPVPAYRVVGFQAAQAAG